MNFCVPAIYLDSFAMELKQENRTDIAARMAPEDFRRVDQVLARAPATLSVDLAQRKVPIRKLLSLRTGDVFPLDRQVRDPVTVRVAGLPKFQAAFGARNGRKAAQILSLLGETEPDTHQEGGVFEAVGAARR